jgi:hypothetical protein
VKSNHFGLKKKKTVLSAPELKLLVMLGRIGEALQTACEVLYTVQHQ